MTEALNAIVSFGLGAMGLHRIQALVRPDNMASAKVIEKAGFQNEGYLRRYYYSNIRGWIDTVIYSRLDND